MRSLGKRSCHHPVFLTDHAALQGIAALVALNILEQDACFEAVPWGSGPHLHAQLSAMRLAFADVLQYGADPDVVAVPVQHLLSKEHAKQRLAASHPEQVLAFQATPRFWCRITKSLEHMGYGCAQLVIRVVEFQSPGAWKLGGCMCPDAQVTA